LRKKYFKLFELGFNILLIDFSRTLLTKRIFIYILLLNVWQLNIGTNQKSNKNNDTGKNYFRI